MVLAGPRGCGKSYCALRALQYAQAQGWLGGGKNDGFVLIQGNKELARDYLMEDELSFGMKATANNTVEVTPVRITAPVLRFAERTDSGYGNPVLLEGRRVKLNTSFQIPGGAITSQLPFGLFLDEINRFSDGLLDSLLLLLEERKVILRGEQYELDIRIVMTMNPPGYDATAKRLSPPLQARIGRMYTICTPDLDTLYGIAMDKLQRAFPDVAPAEQEKLAIRLACFVTLALWGDVPLDDLAYPYLTQDTHERLTDLKVKHPDALTHLRALKTLCTYGPDARCAGDWVIAAKAKAVGRRQGDSRPLQVGDLWSTFHISVLHRLSDKFNEASAPASRIAKIAAAEAIFKHIFSQSFTSSIVAPWYARQFKSNRRVEITRGLARLFGTSSAADPFDWLDRALREAGMSSTRECAQIATVLSAFGDAGGRLDAVRKQLGQDDNSVISFDTQPPTIRSELLWELLQGAVLTGSLTDAARSLKSLAFEYDTLGAALTPRLAQALDLQLLREVTARLGDNRAARADVKEACAVLSELVNRNDALRNAGRELTEEEIDKIQRGKHRNVRLALYYLCRESKAADPTLTVLLQSTARTTESAQASIS